jgi:hypothetical protein
MGDALYRIERAVNRLRLVDVGQDLESDLDQAAELLEGVLGSLKDDSARAPWQSRDESGQPGGKFWQWR